MCEKYNENCKQEEMGCKGCAYCCKEGDNKCLKE